MQKVRSKRISYDLLSSRLLELALRIWDSSLPLGPRASRLDEGFLNGAGPVGPGVTHEGDDVGDVLV